ncbi:MAG: hypothetical protein HYT79_06200 [Elusimicrobia bacterium]|nr:hypothetical protein [Elusimicrobiota bacterium]
MIKLFAHRGGALNWAENTLEAFESAAQAGADGIECDIRLTADDEPVIFHDLNLKRLTGVNLRVDRLTWKEISNHKVLGRHKIPHMEDVFVFLQKHPGLICYFDFQSPTAKLAEVAARALAKTSLVDRCYLLGFYSESADFLLWARSVAPRVRIALMPETPWKFLEKAQRVGAEAMAFGWDQSWWGRPLIRALSGLVDLKSEVETARKAGLFVAGGIADTPGEMRWFLDFGVDGIWTDDVLLANKVLGRER